MDILFSTISGLTGGLIADMQTAMIAMLSLGFIMMGIDYLVDVFSSTLMSMQTRKSGLAAGRTADEIDEDMELSIKERKEKTYADNLKRYGK